eukprot:1474074-Rhodomonas_salina.1
MALLQAYAPLGSPAGVSELLALPPLQPLAQRHASTPAQATISFFFLSFFPLLRCFELGWGFGDQVLLGWAVRRVRHVVVRSCDEAHLRQNLELPPLSEQDCELIDAVAANGEESAHFCWDPSLVP